MSASLVSASSQAWPSTRRATPLFNRRTLVALALIAPAVVFFAIFFVVPTGMMIRYSFYQQTGTGGIAGDFNVANYWRLASTDLYQKVLLTTLKVSLLTTLFAAILAYPVALIMVRGHALVGRILTVIVIAPLLVNVVIRTYGWRVILANSNTGVLNWTLSWLGLIDQPLRLMFTDWAIIIGSVHVFFPLMVLPVAAALGKIDASVEEAARTLGATSWAVFRRITLPLSVPGLAVGATLVFSLTASSFVAPAMLGGNFSKMLGTLVEEQIMSVFDWPFGATIATVMIGIVLVINFALMRLIEGRVPDRAPVVTA
jgi:putative spermidine/putrescine transport system permease protein